MTTLDNTRHCPMCEDAAKKILELEQRVKVLTDGLQKGERAVICKNCGAIYWGEVSQCDCAVGVETQWEEVKVIRSPETDLDEALRRQ